MDIYGVSSSGADCNFPIDDLLDFSNGELFSSPSASSSDSDPLRHPHYHPTSHDNPSNTHRLFPQPTNHFPTDFSNALCVPSDDVAELEWLSRFVDDSFTDFPPNELSGAVAFRSDTSFSGTRSARSKRSKGLTTTPESEFSNTGGSRPSKSKNESAGEGEVRRCAHCASEKTPQWRTGPLGPKTLCNACGVRYKSGRLVPEYRPAASPTFVLTQHSNSHRKVMELRRQKEMVKQQQQQQQQQQHLQQEQMYNHHRNHHQQRDFEVC